MHACRGSALAPCALVFVWDNSRNYRARTVAMHISVHMAPTSGDSDVSGVLSASADTAEGSRDENDGDGGTEGEASAESSWQKSRQ